MRIRLKKRDVVALYCYLRQAERSVHRALFADWSDLREYYRASKIDDLNCLASSLTDHLRESGVGVFPSSREEIERLGSAAGFFRVFLGKWMARRKKEWVFESQEIGFMASRLASLVAHLNSPAKPDQDALISLRMDLSTCGEIVKDRCIGIEEIERANHVEHFQQTDWFPWVKVRDLLGETVSDGASIRSSA